MMVLGIESSCDDTSISIVKDGREIIECLTASQVEEHRLYGGVVPEIASRRHSESIAGLCSHVLKKAGLSYSDINLIAVTAAPGLIGALITGVNFAKGMSLSTGIPLIGVHHLRSHIAANYLVHSELAPPFLSIVVSGGHTHIIEVLSYTEYRILGRTRDDAAGEAFDKGARVMGFPYPGGVFLDKEAVGGNPKAYPLPRPKVDGNELDMSFSGLKTAVINLVHNAEQKGLPLQINDLAASYTAAIVDIITTRAEKALNSTGYEKLVIAGGVSANSHLRKSLSSLCEQKNVRLYMPTLDLCGDNGAMVAAQGYFEFISGVRSGYDLNPVASCPIDEILF